MFFPQYTKKSSPSSMLVLSLVAALALFTATSVTAIPAPPSGPLIITTGSKDNGFGRVQTSESTSSEKVRKFDFGFRAFRTATVMSIKDMLNQVKVIEAKVLRLLFVLPPSQVPRRISSSSLLVVDDHSELRPLNPRQALIEEIELNFAELDKLRQQVTEANKEDKDFARRQLVTGGLETVYGLEQAVRVNFYFARKLNFLGKTYRVVESRTHDVIIQPVVSTVHTVQERVGGTVNTIKEKVHLPQISVSGMVHSAQTGFGELKAKIGEVDIRTGALRVVEGGRGLVLSVPEHLKHAGETVQQWFQGMHQSVAESSLGRNVQLNVMKVKDFFGHMFTSDEEQAGIFNFFRNRGMVRRKVEQYEFEHLS